MTATVAPTSASSAAPTPDVLEEHRNHHRDKAHALLRLTEAVEDSNQRRRRASAAAAKATAKDLGLLAHDLQSQAANLQNSNNERFKKTQIEIETIINYLTNKES